MSYIELHELISIFLGFAVPLIVYVVGYGATQIILTIQSCFNKNEREEIIGIVYEEFYLYQLRYT